MSDSTYEVEVEGQTLRLTYNYTAGDPGRTSGPPEDCYPPEPEEVEITKIELQGEPPEDMVRNPRYKRYHWIDVTDLLWLANGKDAYTQFYQDLEAKILEFVHDEEEPDYDPES